MTLKNAQGKIWYGLHFYPGVAQYSEAGKTPFRVFLNENTIRAMDPTFAGRPVFVRHVDEVDQKIDEVRKEADGWVMESFFNQADGMHWAKFITVTERADQAIQKGWKLSNAYFQTRMGPGGMWNGLDYDQEILAGEYEHLAIVPDPRYEESIILSPEEFKQYNEEKLNELKRLANDKQGDQKMTFNFFKRAKVDNSKELSEMLVVLPKSNKEVSIIDLIKNADDAEIKKDQPKKVNGDEEVEVGEKKMTINDLVKKFQECMNDLEAMKKQNDDEDMDDDPAAENDVGEEDDELAREKALELAAHEEAEIKEKEKKQNQKDREDREAKERADRVRNAHKRKFYENDQDDERPTYLSAADRVAHGRSRYGAR